MSAKPQTPESAPTRSRPFILGGILVVLVTFAGFFGWAAVAQLSSAVIASGTVMVDSNRKAIQHLEGGIVKEILVSNGDAVRKDELLVRLDETRAQGFAGDPPRQAGRSPRQRGPAAG